MIVEDLHKLINSYNEAKKCGLCWDFTYARHDYSNLKDYSDDNKCFVHFILEEFECNDVFQEDRTLGISEKQYTDFSIKAFIGSMSRLDELIYNEKDCVDCDSKYTKHVYPLLECLKDFDANMCDFNYIWVNRKIVPKYNYKDNLDGVFLTGRLRRYYL